MREILDHVDRIVAHGCGRIRRRHALAGGQFGRNGVAAAGLDGATMGEGAGDPTGLMLKSVLMAASWRRFRETNPNPSRRQYCRADFNALLENAMNRALRCARDFAENCSAAFCLRMISAQTRSAFVARENRCTLFRIMR